MDSKGKGKSPIEPQLVKEEVTSEQGCHADDFGRTVGRWP
jgi:hypothetical protein